MPPNPITDPADVGASVPSSTAEIEVQSNQIHLESVRTWLHQEHSAVATTVTAEEALTHRQNTVAAALSTPPLLYDGAVALPSIPGTPPCQRNVISARKPCMFFKPSPGPTASPTRAGRRRAELAREEAASAVANVPTSAAKPNLGGLNEAGLLSETTPSRFPALLFAVGVALLLLSVHFIRPWEGVTFAPYSGRGGDDDKALAGVFSKKAGQASGDIRPQNRKRCFADSILPSNGSTAVPSKSVLPVLLVGEGRSGTSLTLDLLSSTLGPDVFSIFEPYRSFFQSINGKGGTSPAPPGDHFPGGLEGLFNCSFATAAHALPGALW